jgi:uncharacterized protein YraI
MAALLPVAPSTTTDQAEASSSAQTGFWTADFFNNIYLIGTPAAETRYDELRLNWGEDAPRSGVQANNFSARFGTRVDFAAGTYRFYALADDEVIVTLDFQAKIIDTFGDGQPGKVLTADFTFDTPGSYHIQVDLREFEGDAFIFLGWDNLADGEDVPDFAIAPPPSGQAIGSVTTSALNVRSGPSIAFSRITSITFGTQIALIGRNANGSWLQVRLNNGLVGWVSAAYISTATPISSLPVASGEVTPTPPNNSTGIVNTSTLNVRSGPNVSFPVTTVLTFGQAVPLIGRNAAATWVQIQFGDGTTGWVNTQFITTAIDIANLPITSDNVTPGTGQAVVTANRLNFRTGPGTNFDILGVVLEGDVLTLLGRNADGSWLQVRRADGSVGWVSRSWVQTNANIFALPITG